LLINLKCEAQKLLVINLSGQLPAGYYLSLLLALTLTRTQLLALYWRI